MFLNRPVARPVSVRCSRLRTIVGQYAPCTLCSDLGIPPDNRRVAYALLAAVLLPIQVKVLFVAESPPQLNKRGRETYFFLPEDEPALQDRSGLFWALAEILKLPEACGTSFELAEKSRAQWKTPLLREFCRRGYWLLDSAKCAVNGLNEGRSRDGVVRQCANSWLRKELEVVSPEHIVLIKANVFREVRPLLQSWGFGERVLNDRAIPHPGSGQQGNFRELLGAVMEAHPGPFGLDAAGAT